MDPRKDIRAAIIPHHLVAKELMVDLATRLSSQKIDNIFIIGPNHFDQGSGHLITDNKNLNQKILNFDSVVVGQDHACFAPRSVLQNVLPGINFTCILVNNRITPIEVATLSEYLKDTLGPKDVLVASVDFSHYLPFIQAQENDLVTWEHLNNYDIVSLAKLSDAYLDSPQTINILFNYLKSKDIKEMTRLNHLNSSQILKTPDLPSTTSYFEVIYY